MNCVLKNWIENFVLKKFRIKKNRIKIDETTIVAEFDRLKMPLFLEDIRKISSNFIQAFSHWLSFFFIRENFCKLWWTVFEFFWQNGNKYHKSGKFYSGNLWGPTVTQISIFFKRKNFRENFIRNGLFWFNHFCANVGHFKPRQFFGAMLSVNLEIDCQ